MQRWATLGLLAWLGAGCGSVHDNGVLGTIDIGDDFVPADRMLDEDFFICRIQPEVLTRYSCAQGASTDRGGCHDARSALRLLASDAPPPCDGSGRVVSMVPDAYRANLDAVSFSVQGDALTSPLYLRPLGRASHPRPIFADNDPAAMLLAQWIAGADE